MPSAIIIAIISIELFVAFNYFRMTLAFFCKFKSPFIFIMIIPLIIFHKIWV